MVFSPQLIKRMTITTNNLEVTMSKLTWRVHVITVSILTKIARCCMKTSNKIIAKLEVDIDNQEEAISLLEEVYNETFGETKN